VCQPSSACLELTCEPGVGIKPVQCRGLCLPAVRLLTSARFADASSAVIVSLNAPAKSGSFPCSSAFEVSTMGGGATCEVSEQTVSRLQQYLVSTVPGTARLLQAASFLAS
jgi:hypothetical protein